MTPHDEHQAAFGWTNEGRDSTECTRETARMVPRLWPYLLLWAAVMGLLAWGRAEAASAPAAASVVPYLLLIALALVVGATLVGFFVGRATAPRPTAYCPSCSAIHKARTSARRVRAGAPAPCSYSSEHPELMLSRRRIQPPTNE